MNHLKHTKCRPVVTMGRGGRRETARTAQGRFSEWRWRPVRLPGSRISANQLGPGPAAGTRAGGSPGRTLTRWRSLLGSTAPTCCGSGAVPRCPRAEREEGTVVSAAGRQPNPPASQAPPHTPCPDSPVPQAASFLRAHLDGHVPLGDLAHVEPHRGDHVLIELS